MVPMAKPLAVGDVEGRAVIHDRYDVVSLDARLGTTSPSADPVSG